MDPKLLPERKIGPQGSRNPGFLCRLVCTEKACICRKKGKKEGISDKGATRHQKSTRFQSILFPHPSYVYHIRERRRESETDRLTETKKGCISISYSGHPIRGLSKKANRFQDSRNIALRSSSLSYHRFPYDANSICFIWIRD